KVVDFQWNRNDPYTLVSLSHNIEKSGGGAVQTLILGILLPSLFILSLLLVKLYYDNNSYSSSSSAKAAADFEQGADSEPSCHIGVRGMDSEPTFVETTGHCSSDSAPSTPVEMMGHASPSTPVEMMGHASSDSAPSTPVEMMGHASSDSAPSTPVEMMGHSSGDSAPSAPIEMKGHSSSDGDDSSSYESDFHDSEADNELEEDPGSMFDAEPGAELVEPESSEAESDASTRIEIIWHNLSTLKGKFKMGEIPDDVLYGKEVDGQKSTRMHGNEMIFAIYLTANHVQHQRTKHIEIDIYFVRDMIARGHVRVMHVSSHYQYADIFTKGLSSALFEEFRSS
ncbi:ribonuclease H-like domain-containing protein, partial [Tanacetum coccineum]